MRRSSAGACAVLVAVLGVVMMFVTLSGWGGRWLGAAVMQREYLYVLLPFVLGSGAWQGRRESTSGVGELFESTVRPRWQRILPTAGAMAVGAGFGYVVMFAAAAAQVTMTATYATIAVVPVVAVGSLAMVAGVWLGLAVGVPMPSRFTAPLLIITALVVSLYSTATRNVKAILLTSVLSRADNDFSTVTPRVHLGQALWLLGVATGALILAGASGWRARAVAVVPMISGLVAGLTLLPGTMAAAAVPDPAATALVCTDDAPRVCVTKVHQPALQDLRDPAREALRLLAAKLPNAPTAVHEATSSWTDGNPRVVPTRVVWTQLTLNGRARSTDSGEHLLIQLLQGAGTQPCENVYQEANADAVNRQNAAREIVAAWLLGRAPAPDGLVRWLPAYRALVESGHRALVALPAAEQRSRVAAVRRSALACDGKDLLDLLAPAVGPK
jgi:hypothetical protein